jgi:hypothetical protein
MMRRLVRRCDLCSSEMLEGDGTDICVICEMCAEENLDEGYEAQGEYSDAAVVSQLAFMRAGGRGAPLRGQD